jgi:hypothetical protein
LQRPASGAQTWAVAPQASHAAQSALVAHLPGAVTHAWFAASQACHDWQSVFAVAVSQRPGADTHVELDVLQTCQLAQSGSQPHLPATGTHA